LIRSIAAALRRKAAEIGKHKRTVVDLFTQNPDAGSLSLDCKMLDKPHLTQVERLLAIAAQFGG
jgi:citrate lyase beta subunit